MQLCILNMCGLFFFLYKDYTSLKLIKIYAYIEGNINTMLKGKKSAAYMMVSVLHTVAWIWFKNTAAWGAWNASLCICAVWHICFIQEFKQNCKLVHVIIGSRIENSLFSYCPVLVDLGIIFQSLNCDLSRVCVIAGHHLQMSFSLSSWPRPIPQAFIGRVVWLASAAWVVTSPVGPDLSHAASEEWVGLQSARPLHICPADRALEALCWGVLTSRWGHSLREHL